jgi:hypothetical protein
MIALILFGSCTRENQTWKLESPNRELQVEVCKCGPDGTGTLVYTVARMERAAPVVIMDPSPLGIVREDARFVENLEFLSQETMEGGEDHYRLASGKQLDCSNTFNQMELTFRNADNQKVVLVFRAYAKGIAFRYHFPGSSESEFRVTEELTGFDFKEGNFWGHSYDTLSKWAPAYETYYEGPLRVGTPAPWNRNGWAFPILIESEGSWMLVSESGFDGSYGASHLAPECENGRYLIRFAEKGEAEGFYENTSHSSLPWSTPWRFIAIGGSPAAIVETTLPTDLAEPTALEDLSWIRPGRASWSWWSDSDSPQDYQRLVPFVDLASRIGWEYSLVDANWNRMKNGTIEMLADYAKEKNVGLLLWYNSGGRHNVVEEAPRDLMDHGKTRREEFERISKMGIKGVKVDFFQSDKQEIIRQYLEILEDAAAFGLLVNFHGCTLPRGWSRTWPNLVSMEAVRGGENYKFDRSFPELAPAHLAILPYTRNAVGPVDFTPCGFSDHTYPHLTTFGFELALPVVLESGIMHYMDTPEQTARLPEFAVEFLKTIPVAWDQTLYLAGYPGKDVVIARRKEQRWYIGGINGEGTGKELIVDLTPLGAVNDSVFIIGDGPTGRDFQSASTAIDQGRITIHMLPYGGIAGFLF